MPFTSTDIDPKNVKVTMNVRVPLAYRNQLVETAAEHNMSLNEMLVLAIQATIPPE